MGRAMGARAAVAALGPKDDEASVIDRATFKRMKRRWGPYGSWAVWADATESSVASNVGNLSVLDPDSNPDLLRTLRDDVLMIGLNCARPFSEPLRNFHDSYRHAKDFKIRFAFKDTPYYGSWMTDIIKGVPMTASTELLRYLKANPSIVRRNVEDFLLELADLGGSPPVILAFGGHAYGLIQKNVPRVAYSRLILLMHYSNYNSKEAYRRVVLDALAD